MVTSASIFLPYYQFRARYLDISLFSVAFYQFISDKTFCCWVGGSSEGLILNTFQKVNLNIFSHQNGNIPYTYSQLVGNTGCKNHKETTIG